MARRYYDEEEDIRYTADSPRARGREEYLTETKPERTYEIGYEEGKNAAEEAAARAADNLKEESATGAAAYTPTAGTGATSAKPASVTAAQTETKELLSEDYLRKLANGEKFTYDVAKDPTFLSLLARARKEGDLAAKDSIARTTALTGGHGNTYAEQVAQRAAQAQLDAVYDRVPELEAAAYERYRDERSDLRDMYSLLASKEAAANEEAWRNKEWEHTLEREAVEDARYQAEFDEKVRQYDLSRADQREQFAAEMGLNQAKFEESVRQFGLEYALNKAKYEHDAYMDEVSAAQNATKIANDYYFDSISAGQNQQKIDLDRADLNAHIDGSYYKGETSGTTTAKAGYNSDGTKKRTDKEIQSVADSLWSQYQAAAGSIKTLDTFMNRLVNQYSDDADRIMAILENRAAAIDDNITRRGTKVHGYTD